MYRTALKEAKKVADATLAKVVIRVVCYNDGGEVLVVRDAWRGAETFFSVRWRTRHDASTPARILELADFESSWSMARIAAYMKREWSMEI